MIYSSNKVPSSLGADANRGNKPITTLIFGKRPKPDLSLQVIAIEAQGNNGAVFGL